MQSNRRGGVLAGVAIGVLVLAVLAAVALVCTGLYVAHNVTVTHRDGRNKQVTVETPFGSFRVRERQADASLMGVPVYPGAQRLDDRQKLASFEFDLGATHKEFAIVATEYTSTDTVDQVRRFYREQLPHWMITERHGTGVKFEFTQDGFKKIIVLKQKHGETHIVLASVGEPAAN